MDLEIVMKCHSCPFIVNCLGSYISRVSPLLVLLKVTDFCSFITRAVNVSPGYYECGLRLLSKEFSNGNRTEWSPIRSVIIRVMNKIGRPRSGSPICLITSMITDQIGLHSVLLPISRNFNKICNIIGYFLNQNTRNSKFCFASSEKKAIEARARLRVLSNYLGMMHTVLLNCPIKAEIRAVDSQSDLTILL